MHFINISRIVLLALLVFSCKKPEDQKPAPSTLKNGMLVLNEGLFQLNNASLSWVDFSSGAVNGEFFEQKTGRLLGDTGNDLQRYGGKIYIVVNVSSTVEVLDARTGNPLKQILMMNGSVAKQPRNIVFSGANAFISCFDGFVDVLDTASLEIVQRIPVGLNPENMVASAGKVFVSNSGGLNTPVMDSTVSVIDAATLTETAKIVVGKNPGTLIADHEGDIYVIVRGNYGSVPSRMKRIEVSALAVADSFPFDASGIERMGDKLLILYYNNTTQAGNVALFDAETDLIENPSWLDVSQVETLYSVVYRPSNQHIYVLDGKGYTNTGYVLEYGSSGQYLRSYHVGLNPNSILFYE